MLESLTPAHFHPLVGHTFTLQLDATVLPLTLTTVEEKDATANPLRAPFILHLLGPQKPLLPQRIYPLHHEQLGTLELFMVPVGQQAAGIEYEVVFG